MKKILLGFLIFAGYLQLATAQSAKTHPPVQGTEPSPESLKIHGWPGKAAVPPAANPFGVSARPYAPMSALTHSVDAETPIEVTPGENGLPVFFKGSTLVSQNADADKPVGERALEYLASLEPVGLKQPASEFVVSSSHTDEQGNVHVRLAQVFQGIPVYGGDMIAHAKDGVFNMLNGRYYPTPKLSVTTPAITADAAVKNVIDAIGTDRVKTDWTDEERLLVGGREQQTELVIYHPDRALNAERLAWHVTIYPNLLHRREYFVDALTGAIIHQFDHTCEILPVSGKHAAAGSVESPTPTPMPEPAASLDVVDGPVNASGLDLMNVNRSFGAWLVGSTVVLEDASKLMFNSTASQMPGNPVGAIVTLNANNTSPEVQSTFNYDFVTSASTTFSDKNAVSTHWNAVQSYNYYQNIHTRKSIDGVGGNILSFFNVSESNGTSMENAYWNGAAMWYGNGGSTFYQLARGIDVGGHEMTHGVIEKTANMEYQGESGALNESFADVFAVFIDPNDYKIGEDVVKPGATTNNCLRDMSDPHKSDPAQPNHVSEKYTGSQDNGGVHINSGIPNRAFYLFASNASVGLAKAEKVYYKALQDYLVKSSRFIDCRLAIIQAANDLYGSAVASIAGDAFTTVGIVGNQGGNYLGELAVNPGNDYIVCATDNLQNVDLYNGSGQLVKTLYTGGIASRPSVSDDGRQIAFVDATGNLVGIDISYNTPLASSASILSDQPEWRSAAISKDGRFLAALTKTQNNRIYVFDLQDVFFQSETYFLYNPTYSTGQVTGEVKYADVLEFDYSGEYLMYDAYNELVNNQGDDLSYWDIGFVQFWKDGAYTDGATAFISKLFSGLPEKTSVGDPTFAKNSPYIIAFDVIDGLNNRYDIYGANTETGEYSTIVSDNGNLGWPSYNRLDNALIFDRPVNNSTSVYRRSLGSNKITGSGAANPFISARNWGAWFANGFRSLSVAVDEPSVSPLQPAAAPNPTNDALRLSFTAPGNGPVQVSVCDLTGRTLLSREWTAVAGRNEMDLSLQGLPEGTYAVRLQVEGLGTVLKVVKM